MALPTIDTQLVGTKVLAVTDLGLATSIYGGVNNTVTGIPFDMGAPATVLVLAQLSSGSGTINICVSDNAADAIANIGSPTATMSLSSTTKIWQTVTGTNNAVAGMQDQLTFVPAASTVCCIQQVAGSGGMVFASGGLVVLSLLELRGGEDWYCIRAGAPNAVIGCTGQGSYPSTTTPVGYGDGSGVLYLTDL